MKPLLKLTCLYLLIFSVPFGESWSGAVAQTRNPAQDINRANIWHFGAQSGFMAFDAPSLHFENGTPYVMNIGPGKTITTICDTAGNFQITGGAYNLYNNTLTTIKNAQE